MVRKLIPLLRLANALDRTHYSVVESVRSTVTKEGVELEVVTDRDAELELWTARRQGRYFEESYELPIRIVLKAAEDREAHHVEPAERTALDAAQLPGAANYRGGD